MTEKLDSLLQQMRNAPLDRDLNNLWTNGGLLYGLPMR